MLRSLNNFSRRLCSTRSPITHVWQSSSVGLPRFSLQRNTWASAAPSRFFSSEQEDAAHRQDRYGGLVKRINMLRKTSSLGFAWVTPLALHKGMEGCIMARIQNSPDINLIGVRMMKPSDEFIDEYIQTHLDIYQTPFRPFVEYLQSLKSSNASERGFPNHIMLMLFEGKNCRQKILEAIGEDLPDPRRADVGKHIRGAYGFHRRDPATDKVTTFEPAIVSAHSGASNAAYLRLFSKYTEQDGGVLIGEHDWDSCGLVMLKPDLFERPSARPGHIMDSLASTGLELVGARLFSMSIKDALKFYGFLTDIFARKLSPQVENTLREKLDGAFDFKVGDWEYEVMTALLKRKHAQAEVDSIIHYITGLYPHPDMTEAELRKRGPAKLLALVYQGPNAIETIREKLGATDPKGATHGTIRSDFGRDVMRNSVHASDSIESMHREKSIIGIQRTWDENRRSALSPQHSPSAIKTIIDTWLSIDPQPEGPQPSVVDPFGATQQ